MLQTKPTFATCSEELCEHQETTAQIDVNAQPNWDGLLVMNDHDLGKIQSQTGEAWDLP